jgi:hypothetical protein
MLRKIAILWALIPLVASGCAGCTTGQIGGSGSQSITFDSDGAHPSNEGGYWDGQAMDMRAKQTPFGLGR